MANLKGYNIIGLDDMIAELGECRVREMLSTFTSINNDVESFLRSKAITFSQQSLSRTHLVYASYKNEPVLVGYFTLSLKHIVVKKSALNSKLKNKLRKFSTKNADTKEYVVTATLIGQLGKNFTNGYGELITGNELLGIACSKIEEVQKIAGGKIIYLECEDIPKLLNFYERNGFYCFGKRELEGDEKDQYSGKFLNQLLKYTKST